MISSLFYFVTMKHIKNRDYQFVDNRQNNVNLCSTSTPPLPTNPK